MSQRPAGPPGGYGIDLPTGVLPPEVEAHTTDPLAAVSLAFGSGTLLFGLCCFPFLGGLLGLTGIVLGVVSLTRIAAQPRRYTGKGLAITGIVVSVVGPLVYAVAFYLMTL